MICVCLCPDCKLIMYEQTLEIVTAWQHNPIIVPHLVDVPRRTAGTQASGVNRPIAPTVSGGTDGSTLRPSSDHYKGTVCVRPLCCCAICRLSTTSKGVCGMSHVAVDSRSPVHSRTSYLKRVKSERATTLRLPSSISPIQL